MELTRSSFSTSIGVVDQITNIVNTSRILLWLVLGHKANKFSQNLNCRYTEINQYSESCLCNADSAYSLKSWNMSDVS